MNRRFVLYLAFLTICLASVSCASNLAIRKDKAEVARTIGEGYLGEGNVSAALGELLRAEKLYDKDPYLHYALGLAYFAKEEFELAISHFDKAVDLKPDYSEAFNSMGTVYLRLKEWDKAISCFNKARANLLYATSYFALNNLGDAYRGKKSYELAIDFYKKALEDNRRFANAHRGLGLTYLDLGDYEAAVRSLEKAVKYAPGFAPAQYDLGLAYTGRYDTGKAMAAFKKVVALVPDSPLADSALAEIRRLQEY
ncbi:MAG: tetratricopeptide repeat protein [Proteobacteria bacterium]|jgi:tetratricopeptide (TPR) repeat protein|nr:tetratricopeptide repeat protein [Pseudomonadota bacterium]